MLPNAQAREQKWNFSSNNVISSQIKFKIANDTFANGWMINPKKITKQAPLCES